MENWLRTNEFQEAVISLEVVADQLPKVVLNNHHWKWVIISLHNALQGFMVLALQGSLYVNVLTEECAKQWIKAYDSGEKNYPKPKLGSFLNLYKKIISERMLLYSNSNVFKPKDTEGKSIKELNSLRNEFIHFVPKGWSLELSGLPQIVDDNLNIIGFLAFESNNIVWHNNALEQLTKKYIDLAKTSILFIKENYKQKAG